MQLESKNEIEVQLTKDQVQKIKDTTGMLVSRLRLNVLKKKHEDESESPRLLECIVI